MSKFTPAFRAIGPGDVKSFSMQSREYPNLKLAIDAMLRAHPDCNEASALRSYVWADSPSDLIHFRDQETAGHIMDCYHGECMDALSLEVARTQTGALTFVLASKFNPESALADFSQIASEFGRISPSS